MFRILVVVALALSMTAKVEAERAVTDVTVIATIHGLHAKSAGYSYDKLYALVKSLHPDYVGVEMRQEDLPRDSKYLASMYPREMIQTATDYGARAFGFDWLGDDVAGLALAQAGWGENNRSIGRIFLEHTLLVSDVMVSLELACRKSGYVSSNVDSRTRSCYQHRRVALRCRRTTRSRDRSSSRRCAPA